MIHLAFLMDFDWWAIVGDDEGELSVMLESTLKEKALSEGLALLPILRTAQMSVKFPVAQETGNLVYLEGQIDLEKKTIVGLDGHDHELATGFISHNKTWVVHQDDEGLLRA